MTKFYRDLQRYVAITAVGPSALRNQGSPGVVEAARNRLASLDLRILRAANEDSFLRALDRETEKLKRAFPMGARNWGAARKALNLFLRDICYNRFLCERSAASTAENWLEIPLDKFTATSMERWARMNADQDELPSWPGLKRLNRDISDQFQLAAKSRAKGEGIFRVHLDMLLWAEERQKAAHKALAPAASRKTRR